MINKKILDKKIPSIAGIGVIVIGIAFTTFLVKGPTPFQIQADPSSEPSNVLITNISDSSFTVVYTTDDSVIGTITFNDDPNNLNQVALDERDQLSQKVSEYEAHSITVNSLEPNTDYYFTITSDGDKYKNNGESFIVKTGIKITSVPSTQIPMAGSIISPDGEKITDGLVVVTINGAQKISGLVRSNGNYTIPLNNLRTTDLGSYYLLDNSSIIKIEATSNGNVSLIDVSKNQLSPVPIVTLANNYDFTETLDSLPNRVIGDDVKFPEFDSEITNPTFTPTPTKIQSI